MSVLPNYHFLPAPLWIITALHVFTLTLHFAAMNFMFGGIAVLLMARVSQKWRNPEVVRYVKFLPLAMAATVTLGVAPLLFVQLTYPGAMYAASITSGWFWLMIVAAVIIAYSLLYATSYSIDERPGRARILLTLAIVAMVYVSAVYSSVFSMAERPALIARLYAGSPHGLLLNTHVGTWLFRWLHMVTGAMMVGAYFVAAVARGNDELYAAARKIFLASAIAAMVMGFAYLMSLSAYIQPIMKSSAIWFLTVSVVLALGAMHLFLKGRLALSGTLIFVSLLGMVALRQEVRALILPESASPANIPVQPQWDIFGIFLVLFGVSVALIVWMIRMFLRGRVNDNE